MLASVLIFIALLIMALDSPTPQLRTRRLAIIGIIVLLGLMMRMLR
jgi:hypothetical protein